MYLASFLKVKNRLLNLLRRKEFQDYISKRDFKGYCLRQIDGNSILTIEDSLSKISEKCEKDAVSEYLYLFTDERNRTKDKVAIYRDENFAEVWINAYNRGWGNVLTENLDNIKEELIDDDNLELLSEQETGALVLLLNNENFSNYFRKNGNARKLNYELLLQINEFDSKLFERVLANVDENDDDFLESLVRILSKNDHSYEKVKINDPLKRFVADVPDLNDDGIDNLSEVLNNFDQLQEIVSYGLAPYNVSIDNIEDKEEFCEWFAANKKQALERLMVFNEIKGFLRNPESEVQREKLMNIYRKNGDNFCSKFLPKFMRMGPLSYSRACDFFLEAENPRVVCRKRELNNALSFIVSSLNEKGWEDFISDIKKINGDFEEKCISVFEKYNAFAEAEIKDKAKKSCCKAVEEAYVAIRGNKNENLVDRLIDLRSEKKINNVTFEGTCLRIKDKSYRLAELIISQVELGMPAKEAERLLIYSNDSDLEVIDPKDVVGKLYSAEEAVKEKPKKKGKKFDYSSYNKYVTSQGFSPDLVRVVIEDGFKINKAGKFIGMNYLIYRHLQHNVQGKFDASVIYQQFGDIIEWLKKEKIIIHHTRKGGNLKDASACISINPHVRDIESKPLQDYMANALYNRN